MPTKPRRPTYVQGHYYHLYNRGASKVSIFRETDNYYFVLARLKKYKRELELALIAYCLMPNHWHLVVWPREDGELSRFTGWLTLTHTQRWHAHRHTTGSGHLYQGRFKSFPVQDDEHLLTVCRYVERNALRANLVQRSEAWRWGSLHRWKHGNAKEKSLLASWPRPR